ncbi:hypothetical protein Bpfe_013205, partial [Biomphalaria pfeifferi]
APVSSSYHPRLQCSTSYHCDCQYKPSCYNRFQCSSNGCSRSSCHFRPHACR